MTNLADRTIWTGDNLYILRGLTSASVGLIYLDPPFNRNYAALAGSAAGRCQGRRQNGPLGLSTSKWPSSRPPYCSQSNLICPLAPGQRCLQLDSDEVMNSFISRSIHCS